MIDISEVVQQRLDLSVVNKAWCAGCNDRQAWYLKLV